jgi:predicted transposase/invertase (TIGR01784 family)
MQNPHYLSRHLILDAETHEHKLKDLEFSFIELPKFKKTKNELNTLVEKWVFFIKNAENLEVIPENVDDEGLKSAYQEADRHTWTREEIEEYEYARMRETDDIAREMLVEEKAKLEKQIEMAKIMLEDNESNVKIAKYTGLTIEQIEQLRNEKA